MVRALDEAEGELAQRLAARPTRRSRGLAGTRAGTRSAGILGHRATARPPESTPRLGPRQRQSAPRAAARGVAREGSAATQIGWVAQHR